MKKRNGKLQIHRETLRHLAAPVLRQAAGRAGDTTLECDRASDCACASETFCYEPTRWDHSCGSLCGSSMAHC